MHMILYTKNEYKTHIKFLFCFSVYSKSRSKFVILSRVLRTNKRYPLEKYIHLIISPVRIVELKPSFKHIMFGNKCERQ